MKLAELSWPDVEALSRDIVVLIPTGSCEQHGPHLPVFTDSILATAVAEAAAAQLADDVLVTPTLWLGASGHHLAFAGTLSASMDNYMGALTDVVSSLQRHGFRKFFIINGHGGNNDPNGVALRQIKERHPELTIGHSGYYGPVAKETAGVLEGPTKEIRHACEAEASLMLHIRPDLVRKDKLRDDGLAPDPVVYGMIHLFDEITEEGSLGYATLATPEKGRAIFEAAVKALVIQLRRLREGYTLQGL